MLIHQVTDTHIPVTGDMSVRDNFVQLMAYSQQARPDLLVITGDLPGEDGNREAYEWILAQLPESVPCLVIPGNHDDETGLFEVFRSEQNRHADFLEHIALDEIDLLFVNTASTSLPDNQVEAIGSSAIRPGSVLFIHHPTMPVSNGFMDITYPLQNRDAVDLAIRQSGIEHVFCGHFHTDTMRFDGYNLYLTPSPAFEMDRESVEPRVSPPRVPVREIIIDGKSVDTRVIYLDE